MFFHGNNRPFWGTFFVPVRFLCRELVLWFTGLQCIATVSPVPKDPTHQRQQLWCSGSGRRPWWCSATEEWVWTQQRPLLREPLCLTQCQLQCSNPSPSPDTQKCLFATQRDVSTTAHRCASALWSACQTYSCGPLEVGWRKGLQVICTVVPPNMALDPFCCDFPTPEKPSCSSSTASTSWCPASLPDTSFSSAKFTAVPFLFSTYFQGERGRAAPICIPFVFWFVSHVESLITSGKSCEQGRAVSAFH